MPASQQVRPQLRVIFNNPVMYYGELALVINMRVRISIRGSAVSSPSSVANSTVHDWQRVAQRGFQIS
jgi:hypothetical protein